MHRVCSQQQPARDFAVALLHHFARLCLLHDRKEQSYSYAVNISAAWIYWFDVDCLLIMDDEITNDWKRSIIDRMGREMGSEMEYNEYGSWRLEGYLVEMGLEKNRISRERYIYRHSIGKREQWRSFRNRERKHRLYCAANGRWLFIIEVGTSRLWNNISLLHVHRNSAVK